MSYGNHGKSYHCREALVTATSLYSIVSQHEQLRIFLHSHHSVIRLRNATSSM